MDNIKEWTVLLMPELLTRATCRKYWKRISAESTVMSRPLWRVGDAVVDRRNAGWTTSKNEHPARARTAHKGLLQKRLEEDLS